jgi:Tfp pilus assembly protein PilW
VLRGRFDIRDESGMTLVELLVAMSAGMVVLAGITVAMIVTMRETNRVTGHVEADQQARLAMTKVLGDLHSACVAPQIAPIREESTGTLLSFIHQSGSAVAPVPELSKITFSNGTLTEADYKYTKGLAPNYEFASQMGTTPVFRYYAYSSGAVSSTPLTTPLKEGAATTVQVNIAFNATPEHETSGDNAAATGIQDSALLRLTPPGYSTTASNLPCQ